MGEFLQKARETLVRGPRIQISPQKIFRRFVQLVLRQALIRSLALISVLRIDISFMRHVLCI